MKKFQQVVDNAEELGIEFKCIRFKRLLRGYFVVRKDTDSVAYMSYAKRQWKVQYLTASFDAPNKFEAAKAAVHLLTM